MLLPAPNITFLKNLGYSSEVIFSVLGEGRLRRLAFSQHMVVSDPSSESSHRALALCREECREVLMEKFETIALKAQKLLLHE